MKKKFLTLTCLLIVTAILIGCLGAYLKYDILRPLNLFQDESIFAVPFMLLADNGAQYALQRLIEKENYAVDTLPSESMEPETQPMQTLPIEEETQPPTEPPEPVIIDETWFDDALFIGDSRVVGLRDVARLGEADYFCDLNMTVFKVLEYYVFDKGFGRARLDEALEKNPYDKVFIHLGLNECGNDHDLVIEKYQEIIDLIKEKRPDAEIFIQSVMTVAEWKANDPKFSLERITDLNDRLRNLAETEGLHYIDTNEWAADEEGYLREDIRMDGAHLTGPGYQKWAQWIMEQVEIIENT